MKDETLLSKKERKTNYSTRLKQFDGLTWLTPTPFLWQLYVTAVHQRDIRTNRHRATAKTTLTHSVARYKLKLYVLSAYKRSSLIGPKGLKCRSMWLQKDQEELERTDRSCADPSKDSTWADM